MYCIDEIRRYILSIESGIISQHNNEKGSQTWVLDFRERFKCINFLSELMMIMGKGPLYHIFWDGCS